MELSVLPEGLNTVCGIQSRERGGQVITSSALLTRRIIGAAQLTAYVDTRHKLVSTELYIFSVRDRSCGTIDCLTRHSSFLPINGRAKQLLSSKAACVSFGRGWHEKRRTYAFRLKKNSQTTSAKRRFSRFSYTTILSTSI